MTVEAKNVISLTYELRRGNASGEIIETADRSHPLVFLFGAGNMLESFEEKIKGMKTGDAFEFTLMSDEAYGPVEEESVIDLPIENFMVEGKLAEDYIKPGTVLTMRDENGYPLRGKVVTRGLNTVKMDFNHPMAGVDLNFKGEIIEIREASADELAHGHVHGPGGHHH